MLVWNEQFSVGVRKLDHQHQQLFKIVNILIDNQHATADSAPIADVLESMSKYADYHFKTEERIMMEYGYPEYDSQVREHTEFKTRTAIFCMDAITKKTDLWAEVLEYLQNWLTNHILGSDRRFKDFLTVNGFLPSV
jgi:hemerythrin